MKQKKQINRHGGPGRGQGRRLKYNEETVNVTIRCPISKKDELRALANKVLARWAKEMNY